MLLCLAPWGVWQQAQERADLCHPQGLDSRTSESGYRDDGGVHTGKQGAFSLLHGEQLAMLRGVPTAVAEKDVYRPALSPGLDFLASQPVLQRVHR